jgi:hypothetical protein
LVLNVIGYPLLVIGKTSAAILHIYQL